MSTSMRPSRNRNATLRAWKEQRRKEAESRAAARAKRTPTEQLAKLDAKLGKDVGAVKERLKLLEQVKPEVLAASEKVSKPIKEVSAPKKPSQQVFKTAADIQRKKGKNQPAFKPLDVAAIKSAS